MTNAERGVILAALGGTAILVPGAARGEPVAEVAAATGIEEDPNLDHAWFMPTAISQPRGSWKFSDTELLWLGVSYGVTDRLSLTLGGMLPVTDTNAGWLTQKFQLLRAGRFALAVQSSLLVAQTRATVDDFDRPVAAQRSLVPSLGTVASVCIDRACRSLLSGYAGVAAELGEGDVFALAGASAIVHVSGILKLMTEVDHGSQVGWSGDDRGLVAWYGIRLAGRSVAVDLGVLDPVGEALDDGDAELPLLPWLKVAYRP